MKKNVRRLALVLAMVLAFTATAFAATQDQYDDIVEKGTAVAQEDLTGSAFETVYLAAGDAEITIKFYGAEYPEKATVTYKDDAKIALGGMYLVTLLTKNEAVGTYVPGDGNIQYIDQVTCTTAGQIEFDVYPSAVTDGIIAIYGASGELLVAVVEGSILLGDLNLDNEVNNKDIVIFSQYLASLLELEAKPLANADINGDSAVNNKDIVIFSQFLANLLDKLG